ncbi:hypothetical protein Psal006b_01549 [Piscirickettsia salmonis]|uniref:X-Pro aminopeptidase n=1 Tax=Piscirickettsia salmonis TaxID=1238 RepID=A0A1L6TBY9_PISSA|nr:hypothetical protein [Piscirickettsia salmonis]AKP73995.2 hypothetical protein PSLF89_2273 [Piscirickettsia salmonis LF-89 = ATCC VR-1361]ALB22840.1 X-Pro aminopeptidase [Piscirickettsia salmonis]ALY02820.1 hypothetical protein AWE47_08115 [Piscirickettsia salmonis]AMA42375.1 hypothetical protein AWJ11_08330 [Piscirickettsia salmonis]AOS34843.1 hypothetical protein AVM72_05465 [Piscirickettsia salmonis]
MSKVIAICPLLVGCTFLCSTSAESESDPSVSQDAQFITEVARSVMQDDISQSIVKECKSMSTESQPALIAGKNHYVPTKKAIQHMETAILEYGSNLADHYEREHPSTMLVTYRGWITPKQCINKLKETVIRAAQALVCLGKEQNAVRDSAQLLLIDTVEAVAMKQDYGVSEDQEDQPCAIGWSSTMTYYGLKALDQALVTSKH